MAEVTNERFDLIVIGAGLAGLVSAQRYLDAHPTAHIVILEKGHCVGGVFSRARLYPGFHTQWTIGLSEFADLPMARPPAEDCIGDSYKAQYTMEYLEAYAAKSGNGGGTIGERVRFGVEVHSVQRVGGGWRVECMEGEERAVVELTAEKVMVATGVHDQKNVPLFEGWETFGAPIIHSADFGASNILLTPNTNNITILGCGKSAADMLYESIQKGKNVTWIIREPGFFAPTDLPSPYANALEAAQTRVMSLLQPSVLHNDGWWVWFLHRTFIGIALVNFLFGVVDKEAKKRANYHGRPEAKNFEKLEYSPSIFWQNNTGGSLHHADFWDLIAKKVSIHRAAITSLSPNQIHLDTGGSIPCDALLLGTGWKSSLTFFAPDLAASLGLPHDPHFSSPEEIEKWNGLESAADADLLKRFPILASPPPHSLKTLPTTPYRLYHTIAPVADHQTRSIAFINSLVAGNMLFNAEMQAMWAVAYFDGNVQLPAPDVVEKDIATNVAYMKRRYLSNGQAGNYMVFDMIPYADRLMEEMGVGETWMGKKSAFGVNRPEDLGRCWTEYLGRRGQGKV